MTVPPTKRGFIERPGCRVYYEVTGSGPAIVFAHGLGSNHMTWWQQVPHFASRYTCVTWGDGRFESTTRPVVFTRVKPGETLLDKAA